MGENSTALFRSGHEACTFAYAFNHQQYPLTIMARLLRGHGIGSGRGLFGLDGAAVAGTVKRHVEMISVPLPSIIGARYELGQQDAMAHVVNISGYVIATLGTGGHNRRMVQDLVMYYFRIPSADGRPIKLASIADKHSLHASTITRAWGPIKRRLRELESSAQSAIDDKLAQSGIVESASLKSACNF